MRRRLLLPGLLLAAMPVPTLAHAQAGTIRLVVPFPPGGASDIAARIIAAALGPKLGATVVVENRGGAGGLIGGDAVARAAPDGGVLALSNIAPQGIAPLVAAQPPYHPVRDFTHIALVGETPTVMLVRADSAYRSLAELVTAAKAGGRGLAYGSSGIGSPSHLLGALLAKQAGIALTHVPYRGNAPSLQDLLAGQVDLILGPLAGLTGAIAAGQVRVLGVTTAERFAPLPGVPTFTEQGYPAFTISSWTGISGPAGMAPALVARLNALLREVVAQPDVAQQLEAAGQYPPQRWLDSAGYTALIAAFPETWGPVIRDAAIRPQ